MMFFRSLALCFLVSALTCIIAAPATSEDAKLPPTDSEYPEVIPGPGLPSLESLGLTSADLYRNRTMNALSSRNEDDYIIYCLTGGATTSVSTAQVCINYLSSLGTGDCMVPANPDVITFCSSGQSVICGTNVWGNGQAVHSWCSDVAVTAQSIVDLCQTNGQVDGYGQAAENSNMLGYVALAINHDYKLYPMSLTPNPATEFSSSTIENFSAQASEFTAPILRVIPYITFASSVVRTTFAFIWSLFHPLLRLSPLPIILYVLGPAIVFVDIFTTVFIRAPYTIIVYLMEALYPLYVFCGVACITGVILGLSARIISRLIVAAMSAEEEPPHMDENEDEPRLDSDLKGKGRQREPERVRVKVKVESESAISSVRIACQMPPGIHTLSTLLCGLVATMKHYKPTFLILESYFVQRVNHTPMDR
uniref:Uncharacterized protein n=1 Tax=Psilocybe cubensis TaxID=181762 RepID=A0A8H7XK45_PSICU